jgi:carbonic anhydrase/acetyltransferase-like protein (isoleucine patch superfamily)
MAIVRAYRDKTPRVAADAFIAETATLIGDVSIGPGASVWYGAVLRGDVGWIRVGARCNVQDLVCVHMTTDLSNTDIGDDVTIGHGAIIHGAVIEDGALVGMGAIVLDNVRIGSGAIVAAGAVLPPGTVVAPGTLVRGSAARSVRELGRDEIDRLRQTAMHYVDLARAYR